MTYDEREEVMLRRRLGIALIVAVVLVMVFSPNSLLNNRGTSVTGLVTTGGVGIYSDLACTKPITSITWGDLTPGSTKEINVHVRNEANATFDLVLSTIDWTPIAAAKYLDFSWGRYSIIVKPYQVVDIDLTLKVSPTVKNVTTFSFGIVFEGRPYLLGDINQDGVADMKDMAIVGKAFYTRPGDSRWNASADLDFDNVVDMTDMSIVAKDYQLTLN